MAAAVGAAGLAGRLRDVDVLTSVRPSGTEPKIKVYILTLGADEADAQAHLELYGRWVKTLTP